MCLHVPVPVAQLSRGQASAEASGERDADPGSEASVNELSTLGQAVVLGLASVMVVLLVGAIWVLWDRWRNR